MECAHRGKTNQGGLARPSGGDTAVRNKATLHEGARGPQGPGAVYNGPMEQSALQAKPPQTSPPIGAIERGSPPSSYCALAVVEGQPGAIPKFILATALRSLIIAPGIFAVGVRGKQAILGSLAASSCISGVLLLYYGWHHNNQISTGKLAPWHANWPGYSGRTFSRT